MRRLTAPVRTLAAAAEALGRDVNAPPLPEDGPPEVATAAAAFNTMAARIRRFVQDRTEMLTAIGHDLRTPITRLKLRAEFMEDDEQRRKMLADLEELEAMVSATLAFGRDAKTTEPVSPLDLAGAAAHRAGRGRRRAAGRGGAAGLRGTAASDGAGAAVGAEAGVGQSGLQRGELWRQRAGAAACRPTDGGVLTIEVEDDGPGIPPAELERVFEPFHRGEPSRKRETGGVGLGLPIARNIMRAHGGDVMLANRADRRRSGQR